MRTLTPSIGSKIKHRIDFSLVPIGVILIELSALGTELSKDNYRSAKELLAMRVLHALVMLIIASSLSRIFIRLHLTELCYRTIAITGTSVITLGELIHRFLAVEFHVETISMYRRIGIILLQGCFWFPAFIMVGSKRTEIFQHFREYEQRLISATRAQSRTSKQFREIQQEIQNKIRTELFISCNALRGSISEVPITSDRLTNSNIEIQPLLIGDELRKLSMRLETFGSEIAESTIIGQKTSSLNLLVKQFQILYKSISKVAPLRSSTYAVILIVLILPAYINYFSLTETIISLPIVSIAIFVSTYFITKIIASDSPGSLRNSSILIYLTGLTPFFSNQIGQLITHNPRTQYPVMASALTLPLGYYVFMKILQVLQPHSLDLIKNDKLIASNALQTAVTKVVSDEFSHALSHRWAIYIHGKILTRLAATALKLETATNAGDFTSFKVAVDSLVSLLAKPDAEFEQAPTDLRSEVSSRLDPWIGLLEVDLHIDAELESIRNPRVRDLGEVIEELISNSMRHGKAQKIELRVRKVGEKDIEVIAKDNAIIAPPENQSRYGLGTRIFNLASDGRWRIERVESQTVFTLTMSIES